MFNLNWQHEAVAEVRAIRAFDRVRILEAVSLHLVNQPDLETGPRKKLCLEDGSTIYQLRVGDYRVFYDVDLELGAVVIRHVRRKGRKTTGEIL